MARHTTGKKILALCVNEKGMKKSDIDLDVFINFPKHLNEIEDFFCTRFIGDEKEEKKKEIDT